MKQKVKYSMFCMILTSVIVILLIIGIIATWGEWRGCVILSVIFFVMTGTSLFYSPLSIESTDDSLIIHRCLKSERIPVSSISDVERCYPSSGGLRLLGSGGFMGYWGYFSDIMIGTYFGYFGDRNQCILVKLKDGKQYVISCEEPDRMLDHISASLVR